MTTRTITAVGVIGLLVPNISYADLEVSVRSTGDYDPNGCGFWGDSETLSITDNSRQVIEKRYCSAYGRGDAHLVTDARGKKYVLLRYSEGHGTNAVTDYLKIYEFTGKLIEKTQLTISQGDGPTSRWRYRYDIQTPPAGGLKLILSLQLDGEPDLGFPIPEKTRILTVDPSR